MAPLNVLLVAEEGAGVAMLKALAARGQRLVGVVTSRPTGATPGLTPWQMARQLGYQTLPAEIVKDPAFAGWVREQGTDLLLNVHSLRLLRPELLRAPRLGSFNLHPGPLPRYAGLNAPSWAIFRGERAHGVTIHHMAEGIDTGPIAYQALFPVGEEDTGLSLSARCATAGLELMHRLLETAASDPAAIPRIPQDLSQREYFGRGVPNDGRLCWSWPCRQVLDFIRACYFCPFRSPWGHPRTFRGRMELEIVKAAPAAGAAAARPGTVLAVARPCARVACADKDVWIRTVRAEGAYQSASAVLHPGDRLGASPETEPVDEGSAREKVG